ncbi:hypothetical protein NW762_005468 [Fusarium torreyae]|uniref:Heterokaryon incompatibility domain-containing protein n=1 Tax=Fusarium torreyae TaxID=1237075 RepID=A0A9W8S584_9HYPO|nr:hypothetical protein NW762_005468 [Fusarium torreyae]
MARWHYGSCFSPRVWVDRDSVPQCSTCGGSAREQLQKLVQTSNPIPPVPPNEPAGQLNLSWPSTVPYIRTNQENGKRLDTTASTGQPLKSESESPQRSTPAGCKPGSFANLSVVYEDTLKTDQFRLILLTDKDNNLPDDVVHVTLETFEDQKSPEYEAVSYSWGGEDGNNSLLLGYPSSNSKLSGNAFLPSSVKWNTDALG